MPARSSKGADLGLMANGSARPLLHAQIDVAELIGASVMLAPGLILLGPADSFAANANYGVMASIMPEGAWAALLMVLGVAWIGAILSRRLILRRAGAMCGGIVILWMAISFLLSFPGTISGTLMLIVAVGMFIARVKLR